MQVSPWDFVKGVVPFSLSDFPGAASAVLFTGGCNLRCPTCHNYSLLNLASTPPYGKGRFLSEIEGTEGFLDGIVVSGGEPTIVPGLADLLSELRAVVPNICLHTNGHRPEVVESLLSVGLVDLFAVDVKGPWAKYPLLTGDRYPADESRRRLTDIFRLAESHRSRFMFRTTPVPALDEEDLVEVSKLLPEGFTHHINTYRPPSSCEGAQGARIHDAA